MTRKNSNLESTKSAKKPRLVPEAKMALEFTGFFSRIARENGVSASHALSVANNRRTSKRVLNAIIREARKIVRESERAA